MAGKSEPENLRRPKTEEKGEKQEDPPFERLIENGALDHNVTHGLATPSYP